MILRWICFLLSGAFLLAACSSGKTGPTMPPVPSVPLGEVRLTANDSGRCVDLSEGQVLVIVLEANPSAGYTWEVAEANEKILCQMGEIEFEPESDLLGAPGKQVLRFEAVGAGQTALKLIYHRPWEKGVEPAGTYSIQVVVH